MICVLSQCRKIFIIRSKLIEPGADMAASPNSTCHCILQDIVGRVRVCEWEEMQSTLGTNKWNTIHI